MRRLLPVLAALAVLLAGCGGGHKHAQHPHHAFTITVRHPAPQTPATHRCDPADYAMQCALHGQPRTFKLGPEKTYADGIDFAWSCPNPTTAHDFGASYFSPDGTKNWTPGCVNWWHANHRATVGVYESSALRAEQGYNAGFQDAYTARRQARVVGEPDNRPIDFADDNDSLPSRIYWYYAGADSGMASVEHISKTAAIQLVGIYGGFNQVGAMYADHLVGHTNWQTYAWSGGRWQPASVAPLEQYQNDTSVDFDRAIARDYGQWPYAPKPKPDPYAIFPKTKFAFQNGHTQASEYNTVTGWDRLKCRNPVRRQSCKATRFHLQLLAGRLLWVSTHDQHGHRSHSTWGLYHRGERFQGLIHRIG